MINDAVRLVQYAIVWSVVFLLSLVLTIAIPEAIRRRWPVALAVVAATAVVAVEAVTDEQALARR